ncbi:MAG: MFS transporter [Marinifilaceae bacterium]
MRYEPLFNRNFVFAFLANFLLFFAFYLLLPVLPMYMLEQFNASNAYIGFVLASYTLTALLIRPFGGFLVDFYERKPMLLFTYACFVVYFCGYLFAGTLLMFALVRATHGLAFGLVTISNSTVAIDIMPSSRRNEGIGYFGISTNVAMAVGPMFSLFLYDGYKNYTAIFTSALVAGVLGLLMSCLIKTEKKQTVKREPISLDRFFLLCGTPGAIALSLISFSYGLLSTYVALYGTNEVGIVSGTGLFFIFLAIGLVSSRLFSSSLMAKGELTKVINIGILLLLAGYVPFIAIHHSLSFFLSAFVLGAGYGFVSPGAQAMFVSMANHNQRGTANSTYFIAWDFGIGVGVLVGGQIAEVFSYTVSYALGLALVLVAFFVFRFVATPYYHRYRKDKEVVKKINNHFAVEN